MIELRRHIPAEDIFRYMEKLDFPYQYRPGFARWEASFSRDVDGEGRTLFAGLATAGAYVDGALAGFVQYGRTAIGFGADGEIMDKVSYPVIRQLYFDRDQEDAGRLRGAFFGGRVHGLSAVDIHRGPPVRPGRGDGVHGRPESRPLWPGRAPLRHRHGADQRRVPAVL